jgi:hypothetical protein
MSLISKEKNGLKMQQKNLKLIISATRWRQGFWDMFRNFRAVKNHKSVNNSTTTRARENISSLLESMEFYKFLDLFLTKVKAITFYLMNGTVGFKNVN